MSGATLVVFVGVLVALLLGMVALLVWQEGRRRSFDTAPSYVVDELVAFVDERLDPDVAARLRTDGVERIVNWELRYLQRDGGEGAVAGGTEDSVAYITDRIAQFHAVSYPPDDVRAVLALEAEYLMTVGAIGAPVVAEGDGEA
ncbi:MAG: hypothetical protein WD532_04240 [Acidimicrobiia bacterium]